MMASLAETCCLFYPVLYVVYDFETVFQQTFLCSSFSAKQQHVFSVR